MSEGRAKGGELPQQQRCKQVLPQTLKIEERPKQSQLPVLRLPVLL
jgi:hypothetical protein